METCHSYKLNVSLFDETVEMSVAKNLVSPVLPRKSVIGKMVTFKILLLWQEHWIGANILSFLSTEKACLHLHQINMNTPSVRNNFFWKISHKLKDIIFDWKSNYCFSKNLVVSSYKEIITHIWYVTSFLNQLNRL